MTAPIFLLPRRETEFFTSQSSPVNSRPTFRSQPVDNMTNESTHSLHEAVVENAGILVLFGLIGYACLKVTLPFVAPFIWAMVITLSTWRYYQTLVSLCGGRRKVAATAMALAILFVFAIPITLAIMAVVEWLPSLPRLAGELASIHLGQPPAWAVKLPVIGEKIAHGWQEGSLKSIIDPEKIRPALLSAASWLLQEGANLALAAAYMILSTIMAGLLYVYGENAGRATERFALRIGGASCLGAVHVASRTMQGVFLGVIGTALLQSLLSAIGFALAGVPGPAILGLLCFMTAVLQIGTGLIWIPVAAWLFHIDSNGWAAFTVGVGIFVNTIDSFIKPYFISKYIGELPILLIFVGVIGGFLAWGFIGIFLGSTLLAVAYTVFCDWLEPPAPAAAE